MVRRSISGIPVLLAVLILGACEVPDAPRRLEPYAFRWTGSDTVFRWPPSYLPVRFHAPPGALREYVALGLDGWERQFLYGEFRATVVDDPASADVVVAFAGAPPPTAPLTNDPPVNTCDGETLVPSVVAPDGVARLSDVLRVTLRWFPNPDPSAIANCLARVTAHEIGHAIGIFAVDHAGTEPTDLMFSTPTVRAPSDRDRATVEHLYHQPLDVLPMRRAGN